MNNQYMSPEQFQKTPPSVGQRLHVTTIAGMLVDTATRRYLQPLPETSVQHATLDKTVAFTPEISVTEIASHMPTSQPQQPVPTEMTQDERATQARNQIQELL